MPLFRMHAYYWFNVEVPPDVDPKSLETMHPDEARRLYEVDECEAYIRMAPAMGDEPVTPAEYEASPFNPSIPDLSK